MEDTAAALALLKHHPWGKTARLDDGLIVSPSPSGQGRDLVRFLAQAGHGPDSLAPRQQNLEETFLSLTGGVN